jgi:hypothetical protein
MLRRGAVLLSLTACLASCASDPVVETRTVEVEVPVIVGVPRALTDVPAEPVLPPGRLTNDDLAAHVDALRAWGRGLAGKLREIAGLVPDGGGK